MSKSETAARFPVVMLYDRLGSVGKAMATYTQLSRNLQDEFVSDLRIWRIDLATSPEFSAEVNVDIAAAEVIIMSVSGDDPFPPAFHHWKDGADRADANPPHAVIALIRAAEGPGQATDTWDSVLRDAATQIHPEVFVYEQPRPEPIGVAVATG